MGKTEQTKRALVVDDEPDIRELLELTLARMGVAAVGAATLAQARGLLETQAFDLCLTDMRLPDGDGIDLVRHVQQGCPQLPIAVITAHGNMETAVEALKAGAFDFISKPVQLPTLRELVKTALRLGDQAPPAGTRMLLGDSPAMEVIRTMISKLSRSQAPVYISGESGTGKELVARLIHEQGPRASHPFVAVNCGAIPSELIESELFGHLRGSFSGATADKQGLFQAANGGTLFLDEVADLPLPMQVKLLRAIQEKAVRPVGGQQEERIDIRILSATHKNLAERVAAGAFREDLYYRINVIELHVPSLRERREDLPLLIRHILERLGRHLAISPPRLSEAAHNALCRYSFPGNVRELENILERATTLCDNDTIDVAELGLVPAALRTPAVEPDEGLEPYLENVEKKVILHALEQTRYNKTAAAKRLGISFRALRYRLKKLALE